jgi:hypothetical protein
VRPNSLSRDCHLFELIEIMRLHLCQRYPPFFSNCFGIRHWTAVVVAAASLLWGRVAVFGGEPDREFEAVVNVLTTRCVECHNAEEPTSSLRTKQRLRPFISSYFVFKTAMTPNEKAANLCRLPQCLGSRPGNSRSPRHLADLNELGIELTDGLEVVLYG